MQQIVIIGTIPPCPRCKLLTEIVTEKVKSLGLDAEVRHISYTSDEAAEVAQKAGLTPGTAKDVARLLGEEINIEDMPKMADVSELDFLENMEPELKKYENLFREVNILDNWLRPYENKAQNVGILMTPVLVISGEIKYKGSVPGLALVNKFLSELK